MNLIQHTFTNTEIFGLIVAVFFHQYVGDFV